MLAHYSVKSCCIIYIVLSVIDTSAGQSGNVKKKCVAVEL